MVGKGDLKIVAVSSIYNSTEPGFSLFNDRNRRRDETNCNFTKDILGQAMCTAQIGLPHLGTFAY
ncbi:hypothetical protein CCACVL1_12771 [Corchorus capsularis]|uniref:Uncharacterized protein n=1 Tax=Corchorus capsularis TaxID=210143 RepID=A0A1R3IDW5_COCAP|nr:hypothetical protein CCACVL1_12771 [Corchorus capsularis]